jgi:hypothetical protein
MSFIPLQTQRVRLPEIVRQRETERERGRQDVAKLVEGAAIEGLLSDEHIHLVKPC